MIQIVIDCPHGQMRLSIDEAELLATDIAEKIEKARRVGGPLSSFLENEGYVCRQELFTFFRQYLPEEYISRRIGRVYAAIVKAGMSGGPRYCEPLPLGIICGKCNSPIEGPCREPFLEHGYYRNDWEYYISTSALKKHAAHFMPGGSHELSGKFLEGFCLMMEKF